MSRPLGAEPFGVAGQLVATARFEHDASGERLALAEAVTGGVERLGGLGVGAGGEEPVERGQGVGVGLADLPRIRRDRDGETGGLSAAEPDVQVDAVGLVQGDVVDEEADHAFAVRCGVSGLDQTVGKSVASERIRSLSPSVRVAAAAALARS